MMDLPKKDFDALIAKIQKINALASSPNENEASVASRMVHDLLLQYNLDMSSLSYPDDGNIEELSYQMKNNDPLWRVTLIQTMASFYLCQCYILNYSNTIFQNGEISNFATNSVSKQDWNYIYIEEPKIDGRKKKTPTI